MGRNETLEQEVKFDAPIALALPDLRHLVGGTVRLPEQQLVTSYFDTSNHRLWQQGMTMRHRRTGDQDEGTWTLKLPPPSPGPALERSEATWPGPNGEMAGQGRMPLWGVTRREQLRQLPVLETTR